MSEWTVILAVVAIVYGYVFARVVGVAWYRSKREYIQDMLKSIEQQRGGPSDKSRERPSQKTNR